MNTAAVLLSLLLLYSVCLSNGLPTVLLPTGPQSEKCFELEAAQDVVLRIFYEAPELSEHDTLFLTVNVRPAARVVDTKLHSAPILSRLKPTHARLTERAGNVTHVTEVDGVAAVCLRWETLDAPLRRVGLRVVHDRSARGAMLASAGRALDVDHHLTHMEAEFNRLGMGMQRVLSEADYAKERDSLFHRHTQALDEATVFWPVVQVSILLMTGFAQATHIVRFFKSRRIV